jgi:hypothetical protein
MWCAKCQSEVAVEARPNSQRLHCATCGTEITSRLNQPAVPSNPASPPAASDKPPSTGRNPQELLARWAGNQMFDPYGPIVTPGSPAPVSNPPAANPLVSNQPVSKPPEAKPLEVKPPESRPVVPQAEIPKPPHRETSRASITPVVTPKAAPHDPKRPVASSSEELDKSAKVRIDPAFTEGWNDSDVPTPHVPAPSRRGHANQSHSAEREVPAGHRPHSASGLRGPHFDPARMQSASPVQSFKMAAFMGQLLAYVGATTLTGGAGLVLWGYLGGPPDMAPTGWFTTTVGQMLLFMGVVTLVSAGMEQTTVEVSRRVDTIGEQLTRLERATAQAASAAADAEVEAQLRAEIAELRQQLNA